MEVELQTKACGLICQLIYHTHKCRQKANLEPLDDGELIVSKVV
jgi:hypothetical protein